MSDVVVPSNVTRGREQRTTLMIRNIPNNVTLRTFESLVKECVPSAPGARVPFDFIDLPRTRNGQKNGPVRNLGYAFVNFASVGAMFCCWCHWHDKEWTKIYSTTKSSKICSVSFAARQHVGKWSEC